MAARAPALALLLAAARGGDSRDCAVCAAMRNCSRCAIGPPLIADHGWAQVTRVRARCMIAHGNVHELAAHLDTYAEGLSAGWPSDAGETAYEFDPDGASAARLWPYGVFFFLNVASGAFVNVGRSLRFATRRDAHAHFGIPCNGPACDLAPGDKTYCARARAAGFDSIQVRDAHGLRKPELALCTDAATRAPVFGACPESVELVTASGARCACENRSAMLNCGAGEAAAARACDRAGQKVEKQRESPRCTGSARAARGGGGGGGGARVCRAPPAWHPCAAFGARPTDAVRRRSLETHGGPAAGLSHDSGHGS